MSISFTTIVRDELEAVQYLYDVLRPIVDEFVFVVDAASSDGTAEKVEQMGCKLVHTTIDLESGGFSVARNKGLEECTGDWILSLDADEQPSPNFTKWVKGFVRKDLDYQSVLILRENILDGKHVSTERHRRLFRRGTGRWEGVIHESVQCSGKTYEAPRSVSITHNKTMDRQLWQNRRYLEFYPKLNLGSGGVPMDPEEGWINFDLNPKAPLAVVADVFEELPTPLPASYILASHILEHVSYHDAAKKVLSMWIDKLAPGGVIEVRVPDLERLVKAYASGQLEYLRFIQLMYGGQKDERDYHYNAIDQSWLTGQFTWWGLVDIRRHRGTTEYELRMTGRKPL